MLGSVALSVKALGDDGIIAPGVAEMDGLGVQTSVGVGILVGDITLSANLTQTSTGMYITGSAAAELSGNLTVSSAANRVKEAADVDFSTIVTQTSTGIGVFVGASSKDLNFTQTSVGDILWEQISHTGDTWSQITHTGDSWTEITHSGDTWTEVTRQEQLMASTYTANAGIEKIGAGEQAGTWGTTTNLNMDIIDRAINGVGAITLSATTHTLTTSDGGADQARTKTLEVTGTLTSNVAIYIGLRL